jgi:hypothetical protein
VTRALPRGWGKGRSKAAAKRRKRRNESARVQRLSERIDAIVARWRAAGRLGWLGEVTDDHPREMYFLDLSTTRQPPPVYLSWMDA